MICHDQNAHKRENRDDVPKQVAFYVPDNWDLSQVESDWQMPICYFLNLIHWRRICWQEDDDGFIRLKYDYLAKVIDKSILTKIKDSLEATGIVECDGIFVPGEKSYGYRICEGFRKTRRIVCQDEALNKRVLRLKIEQDKVLGPVHRWLRSHFDLLDFDRERASRIISTMRPDAGSRLDDGAYQQLLNEFCEVLRHRDIWFSRDRFGRVHTPITSLPKELRTCLSVRGQRLIGVDLANSQPLIAGICARQFYRNRTSKSRLSKLEFSDSGNPYCYRELSDLAKKHQRIFNNYAARRQAELGGQKTERPDLETYLSCCKTGKLYESLMEPHDERDKFKKRFYTDILFGKNCWQSDLKDRFTRQYPSIAKMLHVLKEKDHRRSAWIMQSYESTLFIYLIGNRIRSEAPSLPVYTIHDAILTIPDGIELVETAIRDQFARIGIHPTLTHETY